MRWVGHKSENSIRSYAHTTTSAEKKEMADYLNNAANPKENKMPENEVAAQSNQQQAQGSTEFPKNVNDLSFGELLHLTPEQEADVLKELFTNDIKIPGNSSPKKNVVQNVSQNVAQPLNGVMPKMMFNNSNITINFNINK